MKTPGFGLFGSFIDSCDCKMSKESLNLTKNWNFSPVLDRTKFGSVNLVYSTFLSLHYVQRKN